MPSALDLMRSGFGTASVPCSRAVAPLGEFEYDGQQPRDSCCAQLSALLHTVIPKQRTRLNKMQFRVPVEFAEEYAREVRRRSMKIAYTPGALPSYMSIRIVQDPTLTNTIHLEMKT